MGRKTKLKVTKKNVGSANDNAARGEGEDGPSEAFSVAGTGLQEQPKADGGASAFGGGSAPMETTGPPASSTLDDMGPQPTVVGPSAVGTVDGGEAVVVQLISEQFGAGYVPAAGALPKVRYGRN